MIAQMTVSSTSCPYCDLDVSAAELLSFRARLATVDGETFTVHLLCQLEAEQRAFYDISPPPTSWSRVRVVEAAAHDLDERRRRYESVVADRPAHDRKRVRLHPQKQALNTSGQRGRTDGWDASWE